MISSLSNFLNNSIASLSIYDVFIIILFALVLILCVVSGVIIVSSRVKKINLELNKNKSIQEVQDKIITNRLDLILNKLGSNSVSLNNLTNKDIKNAVINSSNEEENINQDSYLEFTKNEEKLTPTLSNDIKNINSDIDVPASENIYVDSSKNKELNKEEAEHIDINQENLPRDIKLEDTDEGFNTESSEADEEIIDINEKLNKKSNIYIDTTDKDLESDENDEIDTSFEKGKSIPLKVSNKDLVNKNQLSTTRDQEDISFYEDLDDEEDQEDIFTQDSNSYEDNGIILANKILNNLEAFSNEEKYDITNFISEDGKYITNILTNKLNRLTKKELIKQLFVQLLVTTYNYPIEDIEDNYEIKLVNNIYKKADIVVFNEENYSQILVLIDTQSKNINLRSLIQIAKFTSTPFIIWTDGNSITYYKNSNGMLKEVSDIPQYEESMYTNDTSSTSQFISRSSYNKNFNSNQRQNNKYTSNISSTGNKESLQNQSQYFSKDMYNIFRKEPYSLSDEYKSIISQYKNFSSTYSNKVLPVSQPYANLPLSNFSHAENNNYSNFNNCVNNNLPMYSNHVMNNNLPPHLANNIQFSSFKPVDFYGSTPAINNGVNLNTPYNNQPYGNNYNMSFGLPETPSNINFPNGFPHEYGIPNYIRFNNYNMYS